MPFQKNCGCIEHTISEDSFGSISSNERRWTDFCKKHSIEELMKEKKELERQQAIINEANLAYQEQDKIRLQEIQLKKDSTISKLLQIMSK